MGSRDGHIELDRPIGSIRIGRRHRQDLGDLHELEASIRDQGLLQPITISPDGTLICGVRRLEVARRLGWHKVNVWVRAGISTPLERLLAEQHENTARKPYAPTEAATLYRELKTLIAEDGARRQQATRFDAHQPADHDDGEAGHGGADSAPPADRTSRAQAAQMVTGRKSYSLLEQVNELERLSTDPDVTEGLRELAATELAGIDADEAQTAWVELDAWVAWLRRTYGLPAAIIPPLWHRHPELVWELSALHLHWLGAYDPEQHGSAPIGWHRDFADARERLRDWVAACGTRLDRDRPTRQTIWPGEPADDAPDGETLITDRHEDLVRFVRNDVNYRRTQGLHGADGDTRHEEVSG